MPAMSPLDRPSGVVEKGAVRVRNDLNPEEPLKSFLVTSEMSAADLVSTALRKFRVDESPLLFHLLEVDGNGAHRHDV